MYKNKFSVVSKNANIEASNIALFNSKNLYLIKKGGKPFK